MSKNLPTHIKCPYCGHMIKISLWAYAHWDIELVATCHDNPEPGQTKDSIGCKQQFIVFQGRVQQ